MNAYAYIGTNTNISDDGVFSQNGPFVLINALLPSPRFYSPNVHMSQLPNWGDTKQIHPPLCLHFGLSASTCCEGLQSAASHQRRTEMNERETTQKRGFKDKRRAWRGLSVCAERCWGSYRSTGSGKAQAFLEVKGRQHGTRSHQHASEKVLIRDCQRAVVYIVLQRRRLIHSFCFKLVWIVVQRILWATRFKLNCNHLGE